MKDSIADVTIVGAGLSGLACAFLLHEAGLDVTVLEAADRIGGRIHSVRHPKTGDTLADLGPTWVWPAYQPVIAEWLLRLRVETFEQFETGDAVLDMEPEGPVQRRFLPGQHGIRRIFGGPQALVDALFSRLPAGSVQTNQLVTSIGLADSMVELGISGQEPVRAKRMIMAMPLRLASQTIVWPDEFNPALLRTFGAMPTWMASQAKAVICYDQPFWRNNGLSGRVASQVGPLVEIHDHSSSNNAALFGFIGWPHEMRKAEGRTLKEQISTQLVRCFGKEAGQYTSLHIEDWATNPHICSRLDLSLPPAHPETGPQSLRQSHLDGHLYFSVAEASSQSPGLIEGALAAAGSTISTLLATIRH